MTKPILLVVYVVAMITIIIGVDVLFFKSSAHSGERLIANIGIILIFGAFFLRFLK